MAYYSTQHNEAIPGVLSKTLHLRIISGQNFPKPRGGGKIKIYFTTLSRLTIYSIY